MLSLATATAKLQACFDAIEARHPANTREHHTAALAELASHQWTLDVCPLHAFFFATQVAVACAYFGSEFSFHKADGAMKKVCDVTFRCRRKGMPHATIDRGQGTRSIKCSCRASFKIHARATGTLAGLTHHNEACMGRCLRPRDALLSRPAITRAVTSASASDRVLDDAVNLMLGQWNNTREGVTRFIDSEMGRESKLPRMEAGNNDVLKENWCVPAAGRQHSNADVDLSHQVR